MVDIQNEAVLSLSEAAKSLPAVDGRRPHPSTIFRWMKDGVQGGVKLESARIGRRIVTSREALQRFVERLSEAPPAPRTPQAPPAPRKRSEAQRARDIERARHNLAKHGISCEGE